MLMTNTTETLHKSVSYDQHEIIKSIIELHSGDIECDLTYGNGSFYKNIKEPLYKLDISPQLENVTKSCSTKTPFEDGQLSNIMFDPPFLTYIKQGREHNSIMGKRFSGYWAYDELEAHYLGTIKEASRILKIGGILIIKCQDIIHNHKMHCTHAHVIKWAEDNKFRIKDLFVLPAKNRMPTNTKGKQKHARIYHSYFIVFERLK
jgi:hypothetical protein